MKLVQLALIGGGAYLALNYLKKRKANKAKLNAVSAATPADVMPSDALAQKETDMVAAELQEVGEEGMAITTEGQGELAQLAEEDTQGMDGWDSDNLTSGI